MMNVSVVRVFLKPSDTGKEPSVHVLFEPPATVELGLCFQLLIMFFYDSSFTTLDCACSNRGFRSTKNRIAQLLLRLPRETCLDEAEHV